MTDLARRLLLVPPASDAFDYGILTSVVRLMCTLQDQLRRFGYRCDIVVPAGPVTPWAKNTITIPGQRSKSQPFQPADVYPIVADDVCANFWRYARDKQSTYDAVINFAQDWLPFYLSEWMRTPVLHRLNIGTSNDPTDRMIRTAARGRRIATISRAQAHQLGLTNYFHLKPSLDLEAIPYAPQPDTTPHRASVCWLGRITPDKGLSFAAEAALQADRTLDVMGLMQDEGYWQSLQADYGGVLNYRGMLPHSELYEALGGYRAMLVTPRWVEAFGQVVVEAQAAGVPVVTFDRGGPAEIVVDGITGFVTPADDVPELVDALGRVSDIDRAACRRHVEDNYGLQTMAPRYEAWFETALGWTPSAPR